MMRVFAESGTNTSDRKLPMRSFATTSVVISGSRIDLEPRTISLVSPDDVVIDVAFAGLNPSDARHFDGSLPPPPGAPQDVPGVEVAGVVRACGVAVSRWKPGDRVFGLVDGGGLSTVVVANQWCLAGVPASLSDMSAAAIPEAFITAHDALVSQGGARLGSRVLVRAAAGGVGSAAVQIARHSGADVIGVTRSESTRQYVKSLGVKAVLAGDVREAVLTAFGGQGADLIIDMVGASSIQENVELLATCGRLIQVGVPSGSVAQFDLMDLMKKRGRLVGTVLRSRSVAEKGAAVLAFERGIVRHLANQEFHIEIDSIFPADRIGEAMRYMDSRGKTGKVLIDFQSVQR
jgi:NADPH:quinone reductase